jgi:hypothetical protein
MSLQEHFKRVPKDYEACYECVDSQEYRDVYERVKLHVSTILGDRVVDNGRTYTCDGCCMPAWLNLQLYALREVVGTDHPLFVAITQARLVDFKAGVDDFEKRLFFACGLHPRLGAGSLVSMMDDELLQMIFNNVSK